MKGILTAAALLALIVGACGAGATPSPPPTHSITGSITLSGGPGAFINMGAECHGQGGYDDLAQGATVTVKDQASTIIATGHLDAGSFVSGSGCVFGFKIDPVPDATFYSIEVTHRGALTYSRDELASRAWQVAFTLGS